MRAVETIAVVILLAAVVVFLPFAFAEAPETTQTVTDEVTINTTENTTFAYVGDYSENITVTVDGTELSEPENYTWDNATATIDWQTDDGETAAVEYDLEGHHPVLQVFVGLFRDLETMFGYLILLLIGLGIFAATSWGGR